MIEYMEENNPSNPTFSEESAQELQALAEQWQQTIDASDRWFAKYAHPLFAQCRTMDEFKRVLKAMPPAVDKERQALALPGNIEINIAYAADSVRQKSTQKAPAGIAGQKRPTTINGVSID